ncbi:hypothetical protein E4U55_004330 [Claviceps digitariae]|nr:hypothetical protein E4U55_004330 [Claviceps digitariae]
MEESTRTAIVTGAAKGVGLAIAKLLAARDYQVVLSDIDMAAGKQAVFDINTSLGKEVAHFIFCDLTKTEDIDNLFKQTTQQFPRFSILINNAGFLRAPFLALDAQQITETIAINLTATVYATHQAIQFWHNNTEATEEYNVVNVTSSSSFKTYASIAAYGAAKAGAAQFTFACRSFGPRIRVNAVAPTAIATGFDNTTMRVPTDRCGPGYTPEQEMRAMGLNRLQPKEVADVALECIIDRERFGKVVYLDAMDGQKMYSEFLPE